MVAQEAEARIAAQASSEERLAVATHVIDNTGSPDDLRRRVEGLRRSTTRPLTFRLDTPVPVASRCVRLP